MPGPVFKNGVVACMPFEPEQLKNDKGRLATIIKKNELVELLVVYGTEPTDDFYIGSDDVVHVRADRVNAQWAKEKYTWQGIENRAEFILVPVTEIIAIDRDFQKGCCGVADDVLDDICIECREKEEQEKANTNKILVVDKSDVTKKN